MYSAEKTVESSTAKKIPEPSGYKLLIKPLEVKEKTDSGIYITDTLKNAEQTASVIGFVGQTHTWTLKSFLMALTVKKVTS